MMTKDEFTEVMHYFFDPLFQLIGGGLAVIIILLALLLVIRPFVRRV